MRLVSLLALVGCAKSSAPTPQAPSNAAPPAEPVVASEAVTTDSLPLGPAGSCAVGGMVVDRTKQEPVAGATVVVRNGVGVLGTLTSDEDGRFLLHAEDVPEKVEVYYAELTETVVFTASACGRALRVALDVKY